MRCQGLAAESYDLYLLGILEGHERDELLSHLAERCETCSGELQNSRRFLFSLSLLNLDGPAPRPELRQRILRSIGSGRNKRIWAWAGWGWGSAATAMALLAAGVVIGGYGTWQMVRPTRHEAPAFPSANNAELTQTRQQNRTLETQLDQLRASSTQNSSRLAEAQRKIETLLRSGGTASAELTASRAEASNSRQALSQAEARLTQMQNQLAAAQATLTSTEAQLRDSESRYRAAADRSKALDQERQRTTALQSRVRELERQNDSYKAVLDRQRQEIQQNMQLSSLLSSPNLRYLEFRGTAQNPNARAHALVANGSQVLFVASALTPLPANRTYQLWLIRGQSPAIVSGGIFLPDRRGSAIVEFHDTRLTHDIRQLAVTDEPAGGSSGPTGHQFFRASRSS